MSKLSPELWERNSTWSRRWTIVLDSIEALTCSCNQHVICTACVLKEDIAKKLKEVKDDQG